MTKLLIIDADSLLYTAASKEEIRLCKALHILSGRSKVFPSKTSFNTWLEDNPKWQLEDFSFETDLELVGTKINAYHTMKTKVEAILEAVPADDFQVCIQGEGNFRKDRQSKFVAYKAQRGAKPLLLPDVIDFTKRKWKDKVVVSNGIETDDYVVSTMWRWLREGKGADVVCAAIDKDIVQNSVGLFINYRHLDDGVYYNGPEAQYKGFWTSVLVGDVADNIPGLSALSEATRNKYGIRRSKDNGIGPVAAGRILAGVESEKECVERVVEAYKESWPEDYKERLEDMCFFLWLQREEGDMFTWKTHVVERLGMDTDEY